MNHRGKCENNPELHELAASMGRALIGMGQTDCELVDELSGGTISQKGLRPRGSARNARGRRKDIVSRWLRTRIKTISRNVRAHTAELELSQDIKHQQN